MSFNQTSAAATDLNMKRITFIRHAKSDWGSEFLRDIDRPLNERGYADAYLQAKWLAAKSEAPDLVLSSPATRALSTALIFVRALELPMNRFRIDTSIFEATPERLLDLLHEQETSCSHLLLFGHNPGFTAICNLLLDGMYFDNIPTCGIVSLQYDVKRWDEIQKQRGVLQYYQFPKDFKNRS